MRLDNAEVWKEWKDYDRPLDRIRELRRDLLFFKSLDVRNSNDKFGLGLLMTINQFMSRTVSAYFFFFYVYYYLFI